MSAANLELAVALEVMARENAFTQSVPPKLRPAMTSTKRVIVLVGGRGSGKSIVGGRKVAKAVERGQRWLCAREFQNSIDDSVHALIKAQIDEHGLACRTDATRVYGESGGEAFYRGLARNPDSVKSTYGLNGIWCEEAATLSKKSLDLLEPTIREAGSQLLFTLNRGSSKDPFSQRYLKPYEKALRANGGVYEDDDILIIEANYDDNPFFPEVLEQSRRRDYELLDRADYNHIWLGHYADAVENAIIKPEWFDACVDAHKKLGFAPLGMERVAYDPADSGDAKAFAHLHGKVFKSVQQTLDGDVNTATSWALAYANQHQVQSFTWDADGVGLALRKDINDALGGRHCQLTEFHGGGQVEHPESVFDPDNAAEGLKKNKQLFRNRRAQFYWRLRERMRKTWMAVEKGVHSDPDQYLSFSSDIEALDVLRAEVCAIPRKYQASGMIQVLSKAEMAAKGIDSPNMADAVMMCMTENESFASGFDPRANFKPGRNRR